MGDEMLIISNEGEGRNGKPRQMSRMHKKGSRKQETGQRTAKRVPLT